MYKKKNKNENYIDEELGKNDSNDEIESYIDNDE